jgi:hypothetical protein
MAYALLIIYVLPKHILKRNFSLTQPIDRGLKKYKISDSDYAIVYEPTLAVRKYITQYILARKDGKKIFKGKIQQGIAFLDFDIILFNSLGQVFNIVNVMHIVNKSTFTEEVELPSETAYASILINQVDMEKMKKAEAVKITSKQLFRFGCLALLSSIGMSVCTMFVFSKLFGGLFRESFIEKMVSSGWVFIVPTIICALFIGGACYTLSKNSKR